ncbi:hypothetical protein [Flavobacterium aquicola]|nr:hypothetical protein [Flavobacterium aquicola]
MRRDKTAFAKFGITEIMIAELETALTAFGNSITDIEAKSDQTAVTKTKNEKGEELRTAIREVMKRVELVFGVNSARYRLFCTSGISKKNDSDLMITAKVVAHAGKRYLEELIETGITAAKLDAIIALSIDFEELVHRQHDKIWERSFLKENRIEQGNSIYEVLTRYTAVGFAIWETSSVAKYNDYIIYNRASRAL